jgi:hypothetical protein
LQGLPDLSSACIRAPPSRQSLLAPSENIGARWALAQAHSSGLAIELKIAKAKEAGDHVRAKGVELAMHTGGVPPPPGISTTSRHLRRSTSSIPWSKSPALCRVRAGSGVENLTLAQTYITLIVESWTTTLNGSVWLMIVLATAPAADTEVLDPSAPVSGGSHKERRFSVNVPATRWPFHIWRLTSGQASIKLAY